MFIKLAQSSIKAIF
ncbi:hypothetical protein [Escherichia coli]|nr:hypothetical protein [Escherichia coli]EMB3659148.1 hypothetical protein [Escherichia coli]